jgi:hypothetical protein
VLKGLRRHRLTLKPNESGLAFDLEFVATMSRHEEGEHFRRRNGRVTEHIARAQQLGAYRGRIEVAGKRLEESESTWLGQRDHSWGIRAEMRTDEANPPLTYCPRSSTAGPPRSSKTVSYTCSSRSALPGTPSVFRVKK